MEVKSAEFIMSNEDYRKCPEHAMPEYAFIGRSNVGKSSLINMLTNKRKLAKVSGTPGKTLLINHFLINNEWYLVDLPGYGYAKRAKNTFAKIQRIIDGYIFHREQLTQLFILIDSRHKPLKIDIDFIQHVGENQVPLALIFTKTDKVKSCELNQNLELYKNELLKTWEVLPDFFTTSTLKNIGDEEILNYIERVNKEIK